MVIGCESDFQGQGTNFRRKLENEFRFSVLNGMVYALGFSCVVYFSVIIRTTWRWGFLWCQVNFLSTITRIFRGFRIFCRDINALVGGCNRHKMSLECRQGMSNTYRYFCASIQALFRYCELIRFNIMTIKSLKFNFLFDI